MTKMAVMPKFGKNPSKIFLTGTGRLISTKLVMEHQGRLFIIHVVCSKDDPGVNLDLLYDKVKFGNLGFSMWKWENSGYLRNNCSQCSDNL